MLSTTNNVKRANRTVLLARDFTDNQNEEENEAAEAERICEQAFSIPLILKEILKSLDRPDLLNTSLVSKRWRFFSREVLRESKNCQAIISKRYCCQDLMTLNALLLNSETVPFNGLSIPNTLIQNHQCTINRDLSKLVENILSKIKFRSLFVICFYSAKCISFKCIQEILMKKAMLLEDLGFQHIDFQKSLLEFYDLDLGGHWLPKLRILRFSSPGLYTQDLDKRFFKELVEASPNLQELHGNIHAGCIEFILPLNLTHAVKDFDFKPTIDSLANCLAFSLQNPKLNKFRFSTANIPGEEITFRGWTEACRNDVARIVKQILESSKETLKKIVLDHLDLILLITKWNTPILKKLTHLTLIYDIGIDRFERTRTLQKIDWAKYFPNLKQVSIRTAKFGVNNDLYLSNAFRQSNSQCVCESVRVFHLTEAYGFSRDAGYINIFKHIFPNVKEFHYNCSDALKNLIELWTAWEDLEALYLWDDIRPGNTRSVGLPPLENNYDSLFLGVHKAEADYLLENIEDLASLEIVPTKPSIFNLPKLKKFEMRLVHLGFLCQRNHGCLESDFLSRLGGHCALSRLPDLSVQIHRHACDAKENCYIVFNHLMPFVKFVEHEDDEFHAPVIGLY